jgi:hypothetical protein
MYRKAASSEQACMRLRLESTCPCLASPDSVSVSAKGSTNQLIRTGGWLRTFDLLGGAGAQDRAEIEFFAPVEPSECPQ